MHDFMISIRCGTLDVVVKMLRLYKYEDGDVLCGLGGKDEESVNHVVNYCSMLPVTDSVTDISGLLQRRCSKDFVLCENFYMSV